jgi:hypothetical protein
LLVDLLLVIDIIMIADLMSPLKARASTRWLAPAASAQTY